MVHTYKVDGMTCGSCKKAVEEHIAKIPDVKSVSVDLENKEATIEMDSHIGISELQLQLPNKYSIYEKPQRNVFGVSSSNEITGGVSKSKFEQLKPLFLILLYIGVASNLIHYSDWNIAEVMLDFMGLFYIVFSFFKMLDLKGFPDSFGMYDPIAKQLPVYGIIYPFIETALGLMFLLRFKIIIALVATLIILGITTSGVAKTLLDKKSIQCACLGTALKLPMTEATIIENAIMILMAIFMLINFF